MAEGFIVINRKIKGWRWWHNPTARSLWLYILVEANWKTGYNRDGMEIKRGQLCRSIRTMAEDTGHSYNTIRYWLKRFSDSGEITVDSTHGYTIVSVLNYRKYQDYGIDEPHSTDSPTDSPTDSDITIKPYNKKTIKPQYIGESVRASFTPPSQEEVDQYINAKGYHFTADEFVSFYESIGWKVGRHPMENWKAACTTWENRRMKSQPSAQRQQPKKAKTFLDMLEEEDRNEQKTDT